MFELKLENSNGNIVDIDDGVKYMITDVTGLNPPSASIFTSKSPNRKGLKYNGSTLNERVVTITIKLLGNIQANRNYLYDWIDTEEYVKIHYRNDMKNVYCEGHIEECDFDIYTNDEVITLAIICADPYWKNLQDIITEITNLIKQFTLPVSISEPTPFSTIRNENTTTIFNSGAETGFKFTIKCLDEVDGLTIFDPNDTTKRFEINMTIPRNTTVIIDTDSSPKKVQLINVDGSVENILKYVGRNPTWFTLKRGNNSFGYEAEGGNSNVEITISFTNKYLGV